MVTRPDPETGATRRCWDALDTALSLAIAFGLGWMVAWRVFG